MTGYEIQYRDPSGKVDVTFLGDASFGGGYDEGTTSDPSLIASLFGFIHPGCKLLKMERKTDDEFFDALPDKA